MDFQILQHVKRIFRGSRRDELVEIVVRNCLGHFDQLLQGSGFLESTKEFRGSAFLHADAVAVAKVDVRHFVADGVVDEQIEEARQPRRLGVGEDGGSGAARHVGEELAPSGVLIAESDVGVGAAEKHEEAILDGGNLVVETDHSAEQVGDALWCGRRI